MPDDDLIIEIPSEAEPAPKVERTVAVEPDGPIEDLKKQLEELTAKQEREKTADLAAIEAARAEASKQAQDALAAKEALAKRDAELTDSNVSVLDNAIVAARAEADGYQRDQQIALEGGDFAKAAEFGRKMAKAEARVVRLEEGKADLEFRKSEQKEVKSEPAKPADPFEQILANVTPRAAKWLRGHPTYVTDQSLNRKANIAHLKAVDEGYVVDSDAYFDFCERELGLKEAPQKANGGEVKTERTKPMPGAPVTRESAPSGGKMSPTQVVLTPGEQARATDGTLIWNYDDPNGKFKKGQAIGVQEMARRKLAMQKQGMYDRSFTDQ